MAILDETVESILRANKLTPSPASVRVPSNAFSRPQRGTAEESLASAIRQTFPFADWQKITTEIIKGK